MNSPILEQQIRRQMGHLNCVEIGAVLVNSCLSLLADRSHSRWSLLCCSLYSAPVWVEYPQLNLSLACVVEKVSYSI